MKRNSMPVVILCGGKGTRLGEETKIKPKPLVEIGGKPILWHVMKIYSTQGFSNFILCLGYKGEAIRNYFYNYEVYNNSVTIKYSNLKEVIYHNPSIERWSVTLVDTGQEALKGARIKKVQDFIGSETFMLTYGDGLSNVNLDALIKYHQRHKKTATLTSVRPPSRFGELRVKNSLVNSFVEKPQISEGWINGGFFVLSYKIFDYLTDEDDCDFEFGALEELSKKKELIAYKHHEDWACMDNTRDVEYLNKLWNTKKAFWKTW